MDWYSQKSPLKYPSIYCFLLEDSKQSTYDWVIYYGTTSDILKQRLLFNCSLVLIYAVKKDFLNSETSVLTVNVIFLTHLDVVDTRLFSCFLYLYCWRSPTESCQDPSLLSLAWYSWKWFYCLFYYKIVCKYYTSYKPDIFVFSVSEHTYLNAFPLKNFTHVHHQI